MHKGHDSRPDGFQPVDRRTPPGAGRAAKREGQNLFLLHFMPGGGDPEQGFVPDDLAHAALCAWVMMARSMPLSSMQSSKVGVGSQITVTSTPGLALVKLARISGR